jgi:hypothetical protein
MPIPHTCDIFRVILYNVFRLLPWIVLLCILRGLIELVRHPHLNRLTCGSTPFLQFLIIRDIRRLPPGGERTFEKEWVLRIGWPSIMVVQWAISYRLRVKNTDGDNDDLADVV